MTAPVARDVARWWGARRAVDVVAEEIVGPLAIADLVATGFDHLALKERRAAGIGVTDDLLALRVILACRRAPRSTRQLADRLGFSVSGIRRAVRAAYDVGALHEHGPRQHRAHAAWRPAARRLVAVELKRADWRRGAAQAWAYREWANAAWIVLGQCPSQTAVEALCGSGLGLGYLGEDGAVYVALRPSQRRFVMTEATVWAGEQALVHALSSGLDPLADVTRRCATPAVASAVLAH